MQCLVSFADHAGRCFPSLRTFALHAGISKSAAGRDLAELTEAGLVTRKRRPGGVYVYQIARRFLPRWAKEQVSQAWDRNARRGTPDARNGPRGVSQSLGQKKNQIRKTKETRVRARDLASRGVSFGELPDPADRWQARVSSWVRSGGKFWLADWGPQPNEPGCWAPSAMLQAIV